MLRNILKTNRVLFNNSNVLKAPALRAFSSSGPIKDKVAHQAGMKEEVRPEFIEMYNELEGYVNKTMPMIKTYYEECGKPYTTKIS